MATYNSVVDRDTDDALIPVPVSAQIIQELPQASSVLSLARTVPMSVKTTRQPVLSALPQAYFVSGDTGLKQTTDQEWENLTLVAEELAVIVPVPEAYLADTQVPLWDEIRPRVVEAFGRKIDAACLFGADKPTTWGSAIADAAYAAGNKVTAGTGADLAVDIARLAELIDTDGFSVNGFASRPGLQWRLISLRSATNGQPVYTPSLVPGQPSGLYGFPLHESKSGGWDAGEASLIAGDWSKAIVGLRQDITFRIFTEGVISDGNGAVVLNLMQQDSVALRATMRLAWQVANPITNLNSSSSTRFPFGIVTQSAT